jgi:tetratricopeptide (TPR) repeat protein
MIITDHFVFIHMHKTGGQSINDAIERCFPNHRTVGYHYPAAEIPAGAVDLPRICLVRNPWDWYVSWYAFNSGPEVDNPLFDVISDGGRLDFKTTVARLVGLGENSEQAQNLRGEIVRRLPESLDDNRGLGLTRDSMGELVASGSGYYSWLFRRMLGDVDSDLVLVGNFENLNEHFLGFMEQLRVPEAGSLASALQQNQRRNSSGHSHYSHYYDDALRERVAERENWLIERYGYTFAQVGPRTFQQAPSAQPSNDGFQKLLGREQNYLQLATDFYVQPLRDVLADVAPERWGESNRQRRFEAHRDTHSLPLIEFEDHRHHQPETGELYDKFKAVLAPVFEHLSCYYRDNGLVVRALLVSLRPGGRIAAHSDSGFSLLNCHRVHIPLITNSQTRFLVGGEEKKMAVGEFWEINNGLEHAVENLGEELRVHLIVDWMPNRAGRPAQEVVREELAVTAVADDSEQTLRPLLIRAYRHYNEGRFEEAEPLFRQVLAADESHVDANNLLGLLCIDGGRFAEAVGYIGMVLTAKPDDAQAHGNIGFALKSLGRLDEALGHLRQSLSLAPRNAVTHYDLGNLHRQQGQVPEALACYRAAVAMNPDFPEAHNNLGSALMQLARFEEAEQSLRQALTLQPGLKVARANLEKVLAEQGK